MGILTGGISDFFAIDIGTTAIRVVQLRGGSLPKSLTTYASVPIQAKITQSDSRQDKDALSTVISNLIKQSGITTRNVVVGIPSNKMFATLADFPALKGDELNKTVQYQIEKHIPMSLDEAKVDWATLGTSPLGQEKVEVLIASVSNAFAESRLDILESIGLDVIAIEPDALALARALTPVNDQTISLVLDIGDQATDLVITTGGVPRLIRSIPIGGESFIRAAMQNLNVNVEQAKQFVFKFGLNKEKLEGQVFRALEGSVETLASEIEKSLKFFSGRYKTSVQKIIVTGRASSLPGFPLDVANRFNLQVEIGNSWLNVSYPPAQYNDLMTVSSHYSVAIGLAERVG